MSHCGLTREQAGKALEPVPGGWRIVDPATKAKPEPAAPMPEPEPVTVVAKIDESAVPAMVKVRVAAPAEPDEPDEDETDPENIRTAYMLRADAAIQFARLPYVGPVTDDVVAMARRAASAWTKLADELAAAVAEPEAA